MCALQCTPAVATARVRILTTMRTDARALQAFAVFIASLGEEADRLNKELPTGRGYVCLDTSKLPATFKHIFSTAIAKS